MSKKEQQKEGKNLLTISQSNYLINTQNSVNSSYTKHFILRGAHFSNIPLVLRVYSYCLPQIRKGEATINCQQLELLAGSMMFTVVGVSFFSILCYIWSYICVFFFLSHAASFSLLHCWSLQVASQDTAGIHKALPLQVCHTLIIQGFTASAHAQWHYSHSNTWGLLKQAEIVPRQTQQVLTPGTVRAVQSIWHFTSNEKKNHVFWATVANILPFFHFPFLLPFLINLCSLRVVAYQFWILDLSMLYVCSPLLFVNHINLKKIAGSLAGRLCLHQGNKQCIFEERTQCSIGFPFFLQLGRCGRKCGQPV